MIKANMKKLYETINPYKNKKHLHDEDAFKKITSL
jgi:hypothetical protein